MHGVFNDTQYQIGKKWSRRSFILFLFPFVLYFNEPVKQFHDYVLRIMENDR